MKKHNREQFSVRSSWYCPERRWFVLTSSQFKPRSKYLALLSLCLSIFSLAATPVEAQTDKLGVLRSPENARQWSGITSRLQATGVDYCVVDVAGSSPELDLSGVEVLFLPNVERLNGRQVAILQRWMAQGGKVIVTGPTGSLSAPEVRNQLRSLFGAYWGFPLVDPTTLKPIQARKQQWLWQKNLTSTIQGGVVIPTGLNSRTAAVWLSESSQPAVVVTEKSTFLGWRWGVDTAATATTDTAWLEATLSRYGEFPEANSQTPTLCASGTPDTLEAVPRLEFPESQVNSPPKVEENRSGNSDPLLQTVTVSSPVSAPRVSRRLPPRQIQVMQQELESLISRFENALLAAHVSRNKTEVTSPNLALQTAKQGLANFIQLAEQRNYSAARQEWFHARRTLWDNYPSERRLAQPEIRAMWLDRGTIVKAKSEADLAAIFDRLAAAGINTVFFETVNASYTIYPSRVAPEQNPLTQGWDPLKAAVNLAHERGMELHAWVWIFAAANQRHNTVLNQPANYLGPVLSANPDWAMSDKRGRVFNARTKKAFFDPANPEVRQYLLSLLTEIATDYNVDGIQLDYIRYPFQDPRANRTHGYGVASRRIFKQQTGVDPIRVNPRQQMWSRWTDFRIQQVNSFVALASEHLKSKRPQLLLSTAVFAIPQRDRLAKIQQHWEHWIAEGLIDLLVPMTYAEDTSKLEQLAQPLFDRHLLGSTLLLPGIRLLNLPDAIALDQVQLLRDLPTGGYALFAAENLNPNLQERFSRMQGSATTVSQPLPHRQPFQAAAARYQVLQQEWQFLALRNSLTIEPELASKIDDLARSLELLSQEPSDRNLLRAKLTISSFQKQFLEVMEQQATITPYQRQAWSNRLLTIEQLISYGERLLDNRTLVQHQNLPE